MNKKPLYNFKVGDEVWHISNPEACGTVFAVSNNTVSVIWGNLLFALPKDRIVFKYESGLRPTSIPKGLQPASIGKLKR